MSAAADTVLMLKLQFKWKLELEMTPFFKACIPFGSGVAGPSQWKK